MASDPSKRAASVAATQHGVISHHQLRAAGVSRSTVSRWTAAGRLRRVHPGIYAFGHDRLTRDGWWHAAQLAIGPGGAMTARAGCSIWRLLPLDHGPIDVIPARRMGTTSRWLRVHRTTLSEHEITLRRGLRVTTLARAIIDLAELGSEHDVGTALDQSLLLGLFDRREFDRGIECARGRHGLKILLPAMARLTDHGETFLSRTERTARDRLLAAGLPRPEVNVRVLRTDGHSPKVDLLWRAARLVAEIDGPQHKMPYQRALDRDRDAWLTSVGYRVVRFPVEQIDHRFDTVIARIRHELATSSN